MFSFMCLSGRKVKDDTIDDVKEKRRGEEMRRRKNESCAYDDGRKKDFQQPKEQLKPSVLALMMRCDSNLVCFASLVFLLESVELEELSHFRRCG